MCSVVPSFLPSKGVLAASHIMNSCEEEHFSGSTSYIMGLPKFGINSLFAEDVYWFWWGFFVCLFLKTVFLCVTALAVLELTL